eukprot:m51a1_g11345 hypothetical protein (206) ;mRNA; f:3627-19103
MCWRKVCAYNAIMVSSACTHSLNQLKASGLLGANEEYQEEQQDDQDDINWNDMTTLASMGPADDTVECTYHSIKQVVTWPGIAPYESIIVDYLGPLQEAKGFKYVLIVKDRFLHESMWAVFVFLFMSIQAVCFRDESPMSNNNMGLLSSGLSDGLWDHISFNSPVLEPIIIKLKNYITTCMAQQAKKTNKGRSPTFKPAQKCRRR